MEAQGRRRFVVEQMLAAYRRIYPEVSREQIEREARHLASLTGRAVDLFDIASAMHTFTRFDSKNRGAQFSDMLQEFKDELTAVLDAREGGC